MNSPETQILASEVRKDIINNDMEKIQLNLSYYVMNMINIEKAICL